MRSTAVVFCFFSVVMVFLLLFLSSTLCCIFYERCYMNKVWLIDAVSGDAPFQWHSPERIRPIPPTWNVSSVTSKAVVSNTEQPCLFHSNRLNRCLPPPLAASSFWSQTFRFLCFHRSRRCCRSSSPRLGPVTCCCSQERRGMRNSHSSLYTTGLRDVEC